MYPAPMDWSEVTAMRFPSAPSSHHSSRHSSNHGDQSPRYPSSPQRSRGFDQRDRSPIRPSSAERQMTYPGYPDGDIGPDRGPERSPDRSPIRAHVAQNQMAGRPPYRDFEDWDPTGERGRTSSGGSDQWDPRRSTGRPSHGGNDHWDPRRSSDRPSPGSPDRYDSRRGPPGSGRDYGQQSPRASRPRSAEKQQGPPPRGVDEGVIRPQTVQSQMAAPLSRGPSHLDPSRGRGSPTPRDGSPRDRVRPSGGQPSAGSPSRRPVEQSPIRPQLAQHQMAAHSPREQRRSTGHPSSRDYDQDDTRHPSARDYDQDGGFDDGYHGDRARLMRIPSTEDEALEQLKDFERQVNEVSTQLDFVCLFLCCIIIMVLGKFTIKQNQCLLNNLNFLFSCYMH